MSGGVNRSSPLASVTSREGKALAAQIADGSAYGPSGAKSEFVAAVNAAKKSGAITKAEHDLLMEYCRRSGLEREV